jgi:hypothetical protein
VKKFPKLRVVTAFIDKVSELLSLAILLELMFSRVLMRRTTLCPAWVTLVTDSTPCK